MARERLYLFDTTLRDGAQTNGVDFTLSDKLAIAKALDELGVDYVEGGYPGANPTDTQLFSEDHKLGTTFTAFGMTRRPGRSTSNDPGLAALLDAKADAICFVAKSWDYHVRVALETTNEENLASIRDCVRAAKAEGQGGAARLRAFLRRLQGQSGLRARLRQGRLRGGRALGGAVRHQRRHAAARSGEDRRRGGQGDPRRSCRHPRPQRHRAGGGEFVCGRARGRAADPGHAQRARRALRQRQSRLDHPDAQAQARVRRQVRDRRVGRQAENARARLAHARRDAQPRAQPACALCGRKRLRHQGRHPRLGDHEGARDLRARAARYGRQQAQAPGLGSGRQVERAGGARAHRAQGRQGRSARRRGSSTW